MEARGNPVFQNLPQNFFVQFDFSRLQPECLRAFHELAQAQKRADKLGDHGSQRGGSHVKTKYADQDQIQKDVDDGGDHEVDQRMTAVPYGLQYPDKKVVHHEGQRSGKIDPKICNGAGQNFSRSPHKYQDLRRGKDADEGQQQTADQTEGRGSMDGQPELFHIPRAEMFGNDNPGPDGDSIEKADHQKNQAAGRTDCGKSGISDKIADDQRIRRIIKLLKKISPKKGKRKCNNTFPDRTLCHKRK